MKSTGSKRHLESFKIFPYVAWAIVIMFSVLVSIIAQDLRTVTRQLNTNTAFLEHTVNTPVTDIEDFER